MKSAASLGTRTVNFALRVQPLKPDSLIKSSSGRRDSKRPSSSWLPIPKTDFPGVPGAGADGCASGRKAGSEMVRASAAQVWRERIGSGWGALPSSVVTPSPRSSAATTNASFAGEVATGKEMWKHDQAPTRTSLGTRGWGDRVRGVRRPSRTGRCIQLVARGSSTVSTAERGTWCGRGTSSPSLAGAWRSTECAARR